jgi:hypothetical protein
MNDFLPVIVVAAFMAITAVLFSVVVLISSVHGIPPSLADCGLVAVLCFGSSFLEALVARYRAILSSIEE